MSDWNRKIIDEFRANEGRVGGQFDGAPLLLLHTTGRKSGSERVSPVMYLDLDGRRFVFASKAGADTNPDWYNNLRSHPEVTYELAKGTYTATATPLDEPERARIYTEQAGRYPGFAEYQEKTERVIPVVELVATG
jgi:deazaflavin-dependent oxidoreductase (nitroreductase family)